MGLRTPRGVVERRVEAGIEPRSQSRLVFVGPFTYDQAHRTAIRAMAMVLQTRLRNVLREDLGGTYSVGASASYSRIPLPEYRVTIAFGSDPERTAALQARVFTEIERFRTEGPSERDVNDAREAMVREFESGSTQNGYLLAQITGRYQNDESVEDFFSIADTYRTLTATEIQDAARTYLDAANVGLLALTVVGCDDGPTHPGHQRADAQRDGVMTPDFARATLAVAQRGARCAAATASSLAISWDRRHA